MVPNIALQLQVVLKALADVVVPAIDETNKIALEQLHLSIATLQMVQQRLPLAHQFSRCLLEDAQDFGRRLADRIAPSDRDTAQQLAAAGAAAERILNNPHCSVAEYDDQLLKLNEVMVAAIAGAQDSDVSAEVEKLVIEAAKASIALNRAWCLPAGFESYPARVETIEVVLARAR